MYSPSADNAHPALQWLDRPSGKTKPDRYAFVRGTMAELNVSRKLRIYHIIYRLNLSFANIVIQCRRLKESRVMTPKHAHLYQSFAQELQAEINEDLMGIMESVEADDQFRFGKVRQAWEKEMRDPDDVFLQAEERRKEIARERKAKKHSKKTKKGQA